MALGTPTTKEVSDNIIAQLQASLNQTIPLLPKSFLRVLAKALAGVFIVLYKYVGWMSLQQFVSSATIDETIINGKTVSPLLEWGRLIGVGDPALATNAELLIDINVENQTGSLSSNTQLINSSNGVTYITIGSVLLDAPTVQATVRAVSDEAGGGGAGIIGNLDPGAIVSFANPISNVARDAVVDSQSVTGANGETEEQYRQRVIDRFQKQPQGGAYADYELWGEEPAGIINVYPYTSTCPGQVDVYVEATPESSGSPDGIPTPAQLQEVKDSIELDENGLATRRPAGALVNTFSIIRLEFNVRVIGISQVGDLAQVQSDVTDAINEYFVAREPFIPGLSVPPRRDQISRAAISGAVEDVVTSAGGIFSNVILEHLTAPIDLFILGEGEKAKTTVQFI